MNYNKLDKGSQLNFFPHPEGYVRATPTTLTQPGSPPAGYSYSYVFNYTDHLGNIRLSYTKDMWTGQLKIMEENHYYPFGMKHEINTSPIVLTLKPTPEPDIARPGYAVRTEYQYKYNGKEWQDELGLNMYAMDMRMYDPAIARWVVQDPVIHFHQSPYNAYDGNPVFWADPSGADTVNIGYDREVDSDSISGSVRWSGGLDTLGGGSENEPPKGYNGNTYTDETGHYTKWGGQDNSYVKNGDESQIYTTDDQMWYGVANLFGKKDGSITAIALRAYRNSYGGPQFSPYNPDAMSVNIGTSGNLYVANYDVSLSLIFSPGNISIGGNAGGGFGINSDMPFKNFSLFSPNVSLGFHDMYGGETNVLEGLRGWSVNSTYSGGPAFLSTSTTATPFKRNGLFSPASRGVKSTYLGVSPRSANVGVSGFGSHSIIGSLKNNKQ